MDSLPSSKPLSIFIHRASEHLTDHESHGDGLICFSLLNGLAQRGHHIYAYANHVAINTAHPNLKTRTGMHRSPINSLANWEQSRRADRWLQQLTSEHPIDLVWRMHPFGIGCPLPPNTLNRPLIVGPIFYDWPQRSEPPATGKPRFGFGIEKFLRPLAERGWLNTLRRASLIILPTENHALTMQRRFPQGQVLHLPVIVDPPPHLASTLPRTEVKFSPLRLIFIANLVSYKNPRLFCDIVKQLQEMGVAVRAEILGDGDQRVALEAYCRSSGTSDSIHFAGKVANQDIWNYLKKAHFLVSCSNGEPYGRSIAEAMAVGTPCICHHSGGPADFITHEQDGILVKELDAHAYATAINHAVNRDSSINLWRHLSTNALQTASQWTSEVVLSRLETALLQLRDKNVSA